MRHPTKATGRPQSVNALMGEAQRHLLWTRRSIAPLVLEAAQAAQQQEQPAPGANAGVQTPTRQEAAGALLDRVSTRSQRILRDAIAYDQGTKLSMYWGPFERKHDAMFFLNEVAALQKN